MFRLIQQFQEGKRGGVEEKYANGLMGEQYTDIKHAERGMIGEKYRWGVCSELHLLKCL